MTIKDIAEKAGVSIATVSYVLNGKKKVSEETKTKILKIVQEMGYELNGAARDLRNRSSHLVGVCLESLRGPFFSDLIDGIETTASDSDYNFIITTNKGGERSGAVKILSERRVDGAIILSPNLSDTFIETLFTKEIPLVVLDRDITHKNVCSILLNNHSGISQAITHLYHKGLRNIVFLSGVESHYDNRERKSAYIATMNSLNINAYITVYPGNFRQESGRALGKSLLEKTVPFPDAVLCSNDEMAIGLIETLLAAGIKIPQDISIVGFDDILISRYVQPKLSTISHPKFDLGKIAFETLIDILQGKQIQNITLDTQFIPRESSL